MLHCYQAIHIHRNHEKRSRCMITYPSGKNNEAVEWMRILISLVQKRMWRAILERTPAYIYITFALHLHYITLRYITFTFTFTFTFIFTLHVHYITLHYITSHYITLHYTTLHYVTLHYINAYTSCIIYIYVSIQGGELAYTHGREVGFEFWAYNLKKSLGRKTLSFEPCPILFSDLCLWSYARCLFPLSGPCYWSDPLIDGRVGWGRGGPGGTAAN